MKREADGQPAHLPHRHGEVRIAGDRGEAAGAPPPGLWSPWTASISQAAGRVGRDQGDDIVLAQQPVDPLGARRGGARSRARCDRPRRARRSPRPARTGPGRTAASRASACARLKAIRSASVRVRTVGRQCREIGVQVVLQLGEQHDDLVAADLRPPLELADLDQLGALRAKHRQRRLERRVGAEAGRRSASRRSGRRAARRRESAAA